MLSFVITYLILKNFLCIYKNEKRSFFLEDGKVILIYRQFFDIETQVWVYESRGFWETMDIHPCVKVFLLLEFM
jgi:hypothetical protein